MTPSAYWHDRELDVAGRTRPKLRAVHRRLLSARARDITQQSAKRSTLVLAPHPDDETIGCGAAIMRKIDHGTEVRIVIVADGRLGGSSAARPAARIAQRRASESREACRRLGVSDEHVLSLGVPDLSIGDQSDRIESAIRDFARSFGPEEVISPFRIDNNPDHRSLGAIVDKLRRDEFAASHVLAYPVWLWNRWAWTADSLPKYRQTFELLARPLWATMRLRARIVDARGYQERKRHALQAYESQVDDVLDANWLSLFLGSDELFFALQEPPPPL
jgi:LmbE family N-acetylglucosaminyl deacetylase